MHLTPKRLQGSSQFFECHFKRKSFEFSFRGIFLFNKNILRQLLKLTAKLTVSPRALGYVCLMWYYSLTLRCNSDFFSTLIKHNMYPSLLERKSASRCHSYERVASIKGLYQVINKVSASSISVRLLSDEGFYQRKCVHLRFYTIVIKTYESKGLW